MGGAASKTGDARSLFLEDLRARGITVQREMADGRFVLAMNGFTLTPSLDNVQREFNQTHDPEVVHRFVRSLADSWPPDLTWMQAKANLLYIVEPASMDVGDSIQAPVAGRVIKVLQHYDPKRGELRMIGPDNLKRWNMSRQLVDSLAEHNMAKLIGGKNLRISEGGPVHFAMLDSPDAPSQASLFSSDYFRKVMKSTLGLPVFVALPDRGTLLIFPASSRSQITHLRKDLLNAYKTNSHPITTEIFEVSNSGIRVFKDLAQTP
jgi:hypothetical protein